MNIFDTFDLFLRKPLSILRNGLVSLVHIRAENIFSKKAINVDLMEQKAQITVINSEKVYKILKLTMDRAKLKNLKQLETRNQKTVNYIEVKEKSE